MKLIHRSNIGDGHLYYTDECFSNLSKNSYFWSGDVNNCFVVIARFGNYILAKSVRN